MRSSLPPPRCAWATAAPELDQIYHDTEWGVPLREDRALLELLTLEGAQAGLSWSTVLRKREGYRRAFAGFDPAAVASMSPENLAELLCDTGIVRNRLKLASTVANACALLGVAAQHGSFAAWLWDFNTGAPLHNHWTTPADVPANTPSSERLSRELRGRGFRFVGPTICYALMQASGLVNDHLTGCFRHAPLREGRG